MEDGSLRGGCRVRQLWASMAGQTYRGNAKSPGSAIPRYGLGARGYLRCKSRGVGHPPNFVRASIRRRTQVWRMDLSEVGAEFGSCGHRWEGKRTKEMQNRLEVLFSRKGDGGRRPSAPRHAGHNRSISRAYAYSTGHNMTVRQAYCT